MAVPCQNGWVIYGLCCPLTNVVRYVGVTTDLARRLRRHLSSRQLARQTPVYEWLRLLAKGGLRPTLRVLEQGDALRDWREAERRWIARLPDLLNVLRGGQCACIPPASRKAAGEKLRGRVFSKEHRAKISAAKRGVPRPDNVERNKKNWRPIYTLSLTDVAHP